MIQLQSPSWGIFDAVAFVGGVISTAFVPAAFLDLTRLTPGATGSFAVTWVGCFQ